MMNKHQLISIFGFIVLFLCLFFGCDKTSKKHQELEKSRSNKIEIISIDKIIHDAREQLLPEQRSQIDFLNSELSSDNDSINTKVWESLASNWYRLSYPIISGYYADKIAQKRNDEESWSIAGTTFSLAFKQLNDSKQKQYAHEKAIAAFENANSLNPQNIDHKINLALVYVDNPPQDNPMKGVLMMVDLNKNNPDNVKVLTQLGKLSLRTNQIDKAIQRFEQVLAIDPDNKEANCVLADLFRSRNQTEKSEVYLAKCK